MKLNINLMKFT